MATTVRDSAYVMRHRPLALTILGIAFIFGGFSEGWDRLWEAHFLQSIGLPHIGGLNPVVWFGIINAGSTLLGIAAAEIVRKRLDLERPVVATRTLLVCAALISAGVVAFALATNFPIAIAMFWLVGVARSLEGPMFNTWVNQGLDPRVRATVISMNGQANAFGQFTVGPGIGGLGVITTLRTALAVAGVALSPALILYGHAVRQLDQQESVVDNPAGAVEA
jgi:hypothetical protein